MRDIRDRNASKSPSYVVGICFYLLAWTLASAVPVALTEVTACASELLTSDVIKGKVEEALYNLSGNSRDELTVEFRQVPESVEVPNGARMGITIPRMLELRGSAVAYITLTSDKGLYRRIPVSLRLRTFESVFLVNKRLNKGYILGPEDVKRQRIETTNLSGELIKDSDQIYGKRTRRIINPGTPIRADMIDLPNLIDKGDIVSIVVHLKSVTVTGVGEARRSGRRGDMILVKNVDSGRQITGIIKDSNTVSVNP